MNSSRRSPSLRQSNETVIDDRQGNYECSVLISSFTDQAGTTVIGDIGPTGFRIQGERRAEYGTNNAEVPEIK